MYGWVFVIECELFGKMFNDYDNDYSACNKISKYFHNITPNTAEYTGVKGYRDCITDSSLHTCITSRTI